MDTRASFGVGYKESVDLRVGREHRGADLVLGHHVAEIRLEAVHLETIRDQLPGVLADLDLLNSADKRAAEAGTRAVELASSLMDQAVGAEVAEDHERAGVLRGAADTLTTAVKALEHALAGVEEAAYVADRAFEDAQRLLEQRAAGEQKDQPGPVGEQRTNGHPVDAT